MKSLLNHLIIIISIYILIFLSIKYFSNKNNYVTIKIIYNIACVLDKHLDHKINLLMEDDIDIDYIKPHCKDGYRKNHKAFIINKSKSNELLKLLNENDLNFFAKQKLEELLINNKTFFKIFSKNYLYIHENNNFKNQLKNKLNKTSKNIVQLEYATTNDKKLFEIVNINEIEKIKFFKTKMSFNLTIIFYLLLIFMSSMYRNRALGFVIK